MAYLSSRHQHSRNVREHVRRLLQQLRLVHTEQRVQRALVHHRVAAAVRQVQRSHVHHTPAQCGPSGVQALHGPHHALTEVHAVHIAHPRVVQVGAEGGVPAAQHQHARGGGEAAQAERAQVAETAVPLEGVVAALREEGVPVALAAELVVVLREQVHAVLCCVVLC